MRFVKCVKSNDLLQLVSVNLSWCEMMTAAGVAALAEGCPLLNTFIAKVSVHDHDHISIVHCTLCPLSLCVGLYPHW